MNKTIDVNKGRDRNAQEVRTFKRCNDVTTSPVTTTKLSDKSKTNNKIVDIIEEDMYGIGYLNPAFDDKQSVATTPKSSPNVQPASRSIKSSTKMEKCSKKRDETLDNKTVRRRLDMSSIPDVVQTSQPQNVQCEHIKRYASFVESPNALDEIDDDDEFFLSKNSKLFSQVSSNTLIATDCSTRKINNNNTQINPFHVVAIREMEIVKSVASTKNHVVLPSANVSVEQMPQVVERVEIIEDTETEPESLDDDSEDTSVKTKEKSKELVPILKRITFPSVMASANPSPKKKKKITLRLTAEDIPQKVFHHRSNRRKSPLQNNELIPVGLESASINSDTERTTVTTWKDSESIAEYLILDDKKPRPSSPDNLIAAEQVSKGARKKIVDKSRGIIRQEIMVKGQIEISRTSKIVESQSSSVANRTNGHSLANSGKIGRHDDDDAVEDCESFYGSDKETDDALIFSDDTEIDVCSSSSSSDDSERDTAMRNYSDQHLLDKVKPTRR